MASYNDACCVVSSLCIFASFVETVSQMEKNIRMILHMLSVKVDRQIKICLSGTQMPTCFFSSAFGVLHMWILLCPHT